MNKGDFGYLKRIKRRYVSYIVGILGIIIIMLVLRPFVMESLQKYVTVGMGISIIPVGLYTAKLLAIWRYKLDPVLLDSFHSDPLILEHVLWELVLIDYKKTYYLEGVFFLENTLWVYTKDIDFEQSILEAILHKRLIDIPVKRVTTGDGFLGKISQIQSFPQELKQTLLDISG